jgi:hypothetical protein
MNPEELKGYARAQWWSDHLEWLLENKPALVRRLFRKDPEELAVFLGRKVKQAFRTLEIMKNQGTEERIAEDWVFEEIISPALSADPPEPLPEEIEEKVREWAENYGCDEGQSE